MRSRCDDPYYSQLIVEFSAKAPEESKVIKKKEFDSMVYEIEHFDCVIYAKKPSGKSLKFEPRHSLKELMTD